MTRRFGKVTAMAMLWVVMSAVGVRAEMARYDVDPEHSNIGFSVDHMVVSKTRGQFMEYTGFIEMDPDAKTVKTIDATIKTPSITTNHQKRDTHLKSHDFFDVE
ncbi:MAG: YceI family protein, partial [Nitrospirota bacterium]|nr:YceI family protein [Nitrospirota bacterium]